MFESIKNTRYVQYISSFIASLMAVTAATFFAWVSPMLPLLTSDDSPIGVPITDEEGSWLVSVVFLVSLPFTLIAGWIVERIGRKFSLIISAVLLAIPWIVTIYARSAFVLCFGRAIGGIGLPLITVGCSIYIAEIADKDIRGRLSMIFMIMTLAGGIIVLSSGPFISYTALALICMAFPILFIALSYFLPESPYYLVKKGKMEEAKKVLKLLQAKSKDGEAVDKKIKEIKATIENSSQNKSNVLELITIEEYRIPFFIVLGLKTIQEFSGRLAIGPYMQTIIELSDSSISPEISSVIFGIVPLPAAFLTGAIVDRLGRKPLLIISGIGCAIALIAEGVYFYIQDNLHGDTSSITWLPTTGLIIFLISKSLGVATLPYVMLGELFSSNIKGLAVSVCTFYSGLLSFLLSKFFQPISKAIGIYSSFWIFASSCILGAIFVYFVVPETKGKSFDEIQEKLKKRINRRVFNKA